MIPSGARAEHAIAQSAVETEPFKEQHAILSELDAEWARRLAAAEAAARTHGRDDVAEYLALRATNDLARATGCDWLLATASALAGEANRAGASIVFTQTDAHRFRAGHSTMVVR